MILIFYISKLSLRALRTMSKTCSSFFFFFFFDVVQFLKDLIEFDTILLLLWLLATRHV